jgi:hypothetical protein
VPQLRSIGGHRDGRGALLGWGRDAAGGVVGGNEECLRGRRPNEAPEIGARTSDLAVGRGRGGTEQMFERIRERERKRPGFCGSQH